MHKMKKDMSKINVIRSILINKSIEINRNGIRNQILKAGSEISLDVPENTMMNIQKTAVTILKSLCFQEKYMTAI